MKVPAHTSITVSCKANLGMLHQRMSMAFTPDTDCLPEGNSIPDSVVVVKSGAANKVNVLVVNETSHNIQLDKNTYLGNVEIIKSTTPLQIKKVSAINNDESIENINWKRYHHKRKPKYSLKILHWRIVAMIVH